MDVLRRGFFHTKRRHLYDKAPFIVEMKVEAAKTALLFGINLMDAGPYADGTLKANFTAGDKHSSPEKSMCYMNKSASTSFTPDIKHR